MARNMTRAFAYLRTSSAANVGADKDSEARQRAAIEVFATRSGYIIVDVFYDAAVSGADAIHERAGFSALLDRVASNGVRAIIVESPDRFARDLAVQLAGHDLLKGLGIALIPASAPDFFTEDTPTAVMVRQILGAVAQFEKTSLVVKLKAARDRKRKANGDSAAGPKCRDGKTGKCGGRVPLITANPEAATLARKLRRRKPKGGQMSLRTIARELAAQGHLNERGRPFNPKSVKALLEGGRILIVADASSSSSSSTPSPRD